jgi:hypothetical protein
MANYKKWLQSELDFIANNQSLLNDEALAAKLSEMTGQNITKSMVRRQRRKLSIKKSRGRPRKVKLVPQEGMVENV